LREEDAMMSRPASICVVWFVVLGAPPLAEAASADPNTYDPLKIPEGLSPQFIDLTVNDLRRQREIPIRI
jgi:hypothetical protein